MSRRLSIIRAASSIAGAAFLMLLCLAVAFGADNGDTESKQRISSDNVNLLGGSESSNSVASRESGSILPEISNSQLLRLDKQYNTLEQFAIFQPLEGESTEDMIERLDYRQVTPHWKATGLDLRLPFQLVFHLNRRAITSPLQQIRMSI